MVFLDVNDACEQPPSPFCMSVVAVSESGPRSTAPSRDRLFTFLTKRVSEAGNPEEFIIYRTEPARAGVSMLSSV